MGKLVKVQKMLFSLSAYTWSSQTRRGSQSNQPILLATMFTCQLACDLARETPGTSEAKPFLWSKPSTITNLNTWHHSAMDVVLKRVTSSCFHDGDVPRRMSIPLLTIHHWGAGLRITQKFRNGQQYSIYALAIESLIKSKLIYFDLHVVLSRLA